MSYYSLCSISIKKTYPNIILKTTKFSCKRNCESPLVKSNIVVYNRYWLKNNEIYFLNNMLAFNCLIHEGF